MNLENEPPVVATGGASPTLTRAIREELETYFTEEYAGLRDRLRWFDRPGPLSERQAALLALRS